MESMWDLCLGVDVCGGNERAKEAGLGRGRIWSAMMHSGLGQSHREIWNWPAPQNCPTKGLLYSLIIAWRQPATGECGDLEKLSLRAEPR